VPSLENKGIKAGSSFDPWVEVYPDNLKHNIEEIDRRVNSRPIMAVIKNNGYGLGIVNVATSLEPLRSVAGFAVVKLQEAVTLRDKGIKKPILLLGPFDEGELEEAVDLDILPMVYTSIGSNLEKVAQKLQKSVRIHVCVDTGIGRVGIPYKQAANLIGDLAARKSVLIEGVMMKFTEDKEYDDVQFGRFLDLCNSLKVDGISLGKLHAVSSFGLFQHPDKFLDMVRPGMAIYGIYPEHEFRPANIMNLHPAVSLKCRVAYVKKLAKGESAGYNRAFIAENDTWVATLPVGHADGLPRSVTKGARVRIGGNLYPLAAISASHCVVNIGVENKVRIGDVATIFDGNEGSRPEDFALASQSSVYDLTMHLNPLLPKKIISSP